MGVSVDLAKEPANVRVEETVEWTVRITLPVGLSVVLDMDRSPIDGRPLNRHSSTDQQHKFDDWRGLETPMGEHPVETHRLAEASNEVHRREECQIRPVYDPLPEEPDG